MTKRIVLCLNGVENLHDSFIILIDNNIQKYD